MENIHLTSKQIKEIDEITVGAFAIKKTLQIAMNYHANVTEEIRKREKEWWQDIVEIYKLDDTKTWKVINGKIIEEKMLDK